MNEEMAKLIQGMTYKELTNFAGEIFEDVKNIIDDGQGLNHYAIAEGLVGCADSVIHKANGSPIT